VTIVGLQVELSYRIIQLMKTLLLDADAIPETSQHQIILASRVDLKLTQSPKKFFRHGWQSWTLTSWLDPSDPPLPIRAPEFRAKDEDPVYAFHKNHVSAWVGAVELGVDDVLLVGALGLSGRIESIGHTLKGFYEDDHEGEWLIARGREDEVFTKYTNLLETKFGKTRYEPPPRVWCSWYSLYRWINEPILTKALHELGDLPFDVFQIDDGWQITHGDWEPNKKFPNGMKLLAEKVQATGRKAGIWLAPFMVLSNSQLVKEHPDWLLHDENGQRVPGGITWGGTSLALDSSHPEVLDWLDKLIRKVTGWGYEYLKLDFLYQGALIGKRYKDIPREESYRNAIQVIKEAAGDAYILACGAPIIPSLGACDGIRIGPDVSNYWINQFLTTWLNNPNETSTANAIRTCVHRLWLQSLVNIDPDVMYFRSRHNVLKPHENQLLQDLGTLTNFRATSDLPRWWKQSEKEKVREFLKAVPMVQKKKRYEFQVDERDVNFSPAIPIPASNLGFPIWLAKGLGLTKIIWHQALPAILASLIQ
jgi:alpha-galactosidase